MQKWRVCCSRFISIEGKSSYPTILSEHDQNVHASKFEKKTYMQCKKRDIKKSWNVPPWINLVPNVGKQETSVRCVNQKRVTIIMGNMFPTMEKYIIIGWRYQISEHICTYIPSSIKYKSKNQDTFSWWRDEEWSYSECDTRHSSKSNGVRFGYYAVTWAAIKL